MRDYPILAHRRRELAIGPGKRGTLDAWWTQAAELERALAVLRALTGGVRPARLLDAGCGKRRWSGLLADHVVGVEPDPEALAANVAVDEKIACTIERYEPEAPFDTIVCWNVLEHVESPATMLARFAEWLKPGGVALLAFSNPWAAKSVLARLTPYRVHQWAFRAIYAASDSVSSTDLYPTVLSFDLAPPRFVRAARRCGLSVEHLSVYEGPAEIRLRELHPLLAVAWRAVTVALKTITLGVVSERSDIIAVLRKK